MRKHKMMVAGWRVAGLAGSRKASKEVKMESDGNYDDDDDDDDTGGDK